MNEKPSVLGMIAEAIGQVLSTLGIMAIVTCFFALLIAPVFSGAIRTSMDKTLSESVTPSMIDAQMVYVNVTLWIIAIAAWAVLLGTNLKF